jgi:RNA polymerase sigma factor, sigma-70 family
MEDDRIVDLFLERNEDAITECQNKYGKDLCKISFRMTGDHETTKECENDTYLKAWNLIPPHEPRQYLFAFLAGIIRNITFDRIRRDKAKKRSALFVELSKEMESCIPDRSKTLEEKMITDEISGKVNTFLKLLPKKRRMLFVRRYYYMDSISELATSFGWSESKVKMTLFRIRKQLAEYMRKEGYPYER